MKFKQIIKVVVLIMILSIGLIGCSTTPPPSEELAVGQSDLTQESEAKGASVEEQSSMSSETIPQHEEMAGMETVYFDFDQFTLSSEARETLANNAKYLQANSGVQVVIEGHCDERGSDEYNLALGESRALAAKNYLVSLGVNETRLSVISYGEEKPAVMGSDEDAWAQNRRAEFKAVR
jgi:peptidoglycan-associated lipoprotein